MTRLIIVVLITLVVATPAAAVSDDHKAKIDALITPLIDSQIIIGLTVGIVSGDETVVLGYGQSDITQPTAPDGDTIFEIGSITKTFTGLMFAMAVESGEVSYDQTAKSLLPEGKRMPHFENNDITLAHLATHTSALPRLPDNLSPPDPNNPYVHYTADNLYVFLSYWGLTRAPGEKYEYSNLGMGLLGHLLALQAGVGFETAVIERICKPLGMNDTYVVIPDAAMNRLAKPYNADGIEVSYWELSVLSGAGGLRSTTNDMLKYVQAQIDRTPETMATAIEATQKPRHATDRDDRSVALGWHVRDDGTSVHTGGTGGFATYATVDNKQRIGFIVLSNTAATEAHELGPKIRNILNDEAYEPFEVREVAQLDVTTLDRYTGRYQIFPGFNIEIKRDGDFLTAQATNQSTFRLYPTSELEFYYRVVEARITFVPSDDGAIEKLVLHQAGREMPAPRVE